jgi:thymidylate synthase (FAD)
MTDSNVVFIKPTAYVNPFAELPVNALQTIEYCGRVCYRSTDKMGQGSESFIKSLIARKHMSPLEHVMASFEIICSRACSHQIVRHRLCAFNQESQRFFRYDKELPIIDLFDSERVNTEQYEKIHVEYNRRLASGMAAQQARLILPNSTATVLIVSTNFRQWLHMIKERTNKHADVEIRFIFNTIQDILADAYPCIFAKEEK